MNNVNAQLTNLIADIKKYELVLDKLWLKIDETADPIKEASLTRERDSIFEYVKELRADLRMKEEERRREERRREERRRGASPVKSAQKRLGRRQRPLTLLLRPLGRAYGVIRTPSVSMTSVGSAISE
ncbi:hypothetical protein HDU77_009881 [Chytriomyces hyalinus]|nr:hypothetical protein HDU77_009881 [Chytriomyces hyalinus]